LVENVKNLEGDLSHLDSELLELEHLSEEIKSLQCAHAKSLATTQALKAKLRTRARRADHLRGRLGASLKGRLGFDSASLIGVGFKPRPSRKPDEEELERRGEGEPGG
jgi:hypothetical protein